MTESSSIAIYHRALGLPADASTRDALDRITDLRRDAGEGDLEDLSERELIRRDEHENVAMTRDGAVVTLDFPLQSGTEVIEELNLRRPTTKDLIRATKDSGIVSVVTLLADLTGRAKSEIESLKVSDFKTLDLVAGNLQRPPRRTGRKS